MPRPILLPPVYTDHKFENQAAEVRPYDHRWWLVSDSLGGKNPSYDFWMSNEVEGTTRVNFIASAYPNSHPDLIFWMETDVWHDWDIQEKA
jgi:hypothetical protein